MSIGTGGGATRSAIWWHYARFCSPPGGRAQTRGSGPRPAPRSAVGVSTVVGSPLEPPLPLCADDHYRRQPVAGVDAGATVGPRRGLSATRAYDSAHGGSTTALPCAARRMVPIKGHAAPTPPVTTR